MVFLFRGCCSSLSGSSVFYILSLSVIDIGHWVLGIGYWVLGTAGRYQVHHDNEICALYPLPIFKTLYAVAHLRRATI
jgi:hypothetical protein